MSADTITAFNQLALNPSLLKALDEVGYETPSPIQAQTIPLLLEGKDVVGQAQTGTGKTAAFALPILSRLDLQQKDPQVLVLAPTRELAIQVAEDFFAGHGKLLGVAFWDLLAFLRYFPLTRPQVKLLLTAMPVEAIVSQLAGDAIFRSWK